jgi:hypothetical protein
MTKEGEDIYDEEGREGLEDDSEISPEEEGFMKGYDDADEEKEASKKKKKAKDDDEDKSEDDDEESEEE